MAFLLGAALIFGGLLGLRYRSAILIVALPMAFLLPCGLALLMEAGALNALAAAFLAAVAMQLGFLCGGLAAAGHRKRLSAALFSEAARRRV